MALTPGTRLGAYEIAALIGAGGMGEVYRARDTRLNRDVALKVLPELFAADPDRLSRFKREAQVLASLNHPNIAAIHGFEEEALVLELVEGPTLADRIAQGPIPLDEALPIARQIAEALEAAHEQGVIHRDLKPANIKVRPDGTVKVLDFGLAKAMEPVIAGASVAALDVTASPTITSPAATRFGMILGTAAYMSPEQARGRPVDKRSDIWAFGCVLYEMLTGRRPFDAGDTVSDAVASILTREPDWTRLPVNTPEPVTRLLRRCLQKDPARRLHHVADARLDIDEGSASSDTRASASRPGRGQTFRPALPWAIAAAAIAVAAWMVEYQAALNGFAIWTPDGNLAVYKTADGLRMQSTDGSGQNHVIEGTNTFDFPGSVTADGRTLVFMRSSEETSFDIYFVPLPGGGKPTSILKTAAYEGGARVSPDSRLMIYVSNESGRNEIYLRAFPGPDRRWQVSTDGGTQAVWNPNGREIFYRSGNRMMAVDVSTTPNVVLSPPRVLFEQRYAYGAGITIANYDVTGDGQRFVMVKDESTAGRLNVVLNWFQELERLVPVD